MTLLADLWRQIAALGAARLRYALADLTLVAGIAVCLVAAAVFTLQVLHGMLRPVLGPTGASALLAGVMLIVALVLVLLLANRRSHPVPAPHLVVPPVQPAAPADAASAPVTDPAPDIGTAAAFLAGFLLARRLF